MMSAKNKYLLLIFIVVIGGYIIYFLSKDNGQNEMDRKKASYEKIDTKYRNLGYKGINDFYSKIKQIEVYSKVYNEKKNLFDDKDVKTLSDSLTLAFLVSNGLTLEEYQDDVDTVLSAKDYSANYLEYYYNQIYDPARLKMGFYQALNKDPKMSFEKASKEYAAYHYKKPETGKSQSAEDYGSTDVESIEKWMSNYDGSIFEFEYNVKKQLHDPESFEHIETSYSNKGDIVKVRMKFRAKNKLGSKMLNQADAILNTNDGTVSNIKLTK